MNYYEPRQRQSDQRWDFTCQNDDHVWSVGYCRAYRSDYDRESFADKYHADGHETAEAAAECYRQFVLDQHLRLMGEGRPGEHRQCEVCGEMTSLFAEIRNGSIWPLCKAHNNRETVAGLYSEAPMRIVSSY